MYKAFNIYCDNIINCKAEHGHFFSYTDMAGYYKMAAVFVVWCRITFFLLNYSTNVVFSILYSDSVCIHTL